jgi:hypothetical protein
MPLTKKGQKIRKAMRRFYGQKKGDQVFYAMINEGKLTKVEQKSKKKR